MTIAAVSGIEDREQGLASGLINTSQQVGGALGLAILAAIANSEIGSSHDPVVLIEGFPSAFLVGAGFAVLGLHRDPAPDPHATAAPTWSWGRSRRRNPTLRGQFGTELTQKCHFFEPIQ